VAAINASARRDGSASPTADSTLLEP
jgi:hypothetical protein